MSFKAVQPKKTKKDAVNYTKVKLRKTNEEKGLPPAKTGKNRNRSKDKGVIKGKPKTPLTDEQRKLMEDNLLLAYWCLQRMYVHKWVRQLGDEGESIAVMGLLHACQLFDPNREGVNGGKIKLSTYAAWWIKKYLWVEGLHRIRHSAFTDVQDDCGGQSSDTYTNETIANPIHAEDHREQPPDDKADIQDRLNRVKKWYRPDEWQILMWYYVDDMTAGEIGEKMGCSAQRIRQKLCRLMERATDLKNRGDL